MTRRRNYRRNSTLLCAVLWVAAAIITHIPGDKIPSIPASDKTLHFIGYLVLAGSFLLTLRMHNVRPAPRWILTICLLYSYAALDEATQTLVNRHAGLGDWLANVIGITVATACDMVWAWLKRHRTTRTKKWA
jgi:VanZ family protein